MEENSSKNIFTKQAAKASWIIPLLALGMGMIGYAANQSFGPLIPVGVVVLWFVGFILGIIALFGVSRHGAKGILIPGILGILLNGGFLFMLMIETVSYIRMVD